VGPRAVLDTVVKRKILSPRRESNRRTLIVQPGLTFNTLTVSFHCVRNELMELVQSLNGQVLPVLENFPCIQEVRSSNLGQETGGL
jgi:hypothetical protein